MASTSTSASSSTSRAKTTKLACMINPSTTWESQYLNYESTCKLYLINYKEPEEWKDGDGAGAPVAPLKPGPRWIKSQASPDCWPHFKLYNLVLDPFVHDWPPRNVKLNDLYVYLAIKFLTLHVRAEMYPADFDKQGSPRQSRVPAGHTIQILAHGIAWYPVYKSNYVLCGGQAAKSITWLLQKERVGPSNTCLIGLVVVPDEFLDEDMVFNLPYHDKPDLAALDPEAACDQWVREEAKAKAQDKWISKLNDYAIVPDSQGGWKLETINDLIINSQCCLVYEDTDTLKDESKNNEPITNKKNEIDKGKEKADEIVSNDDDNADHGTNHAQVNDKPVANKRTAIEIDDVLNDDDSDPRKHPKTTHADTMESDSIDAISDGFQTLTGYLEDQSFLTRKLIYQVKSLQKRVKKLEEK